MADSSDLRSQSETVMRLIAALCGFAVLAAIAALPYIGSVAWAAGHESGKFLSTKCDVTVTPPPARTTIYANDGKTVIATLFKQDRIPVTLAQIPKYLQEALISTEDRRFYDHHGVDLRGLLRSAVSTSGGDTQGGSTLTMQYVKQIRYYAAGDDPVKQAAAIAQNLDRKMEDARCAIDFEKHMSKSTILDNYFNIAFFGENSYGIESAAQRYFGVSVNSAQLTVPRAAMLVGLLRAPTAYDPFLHIKAATDRRNEVLQNMVSMKYLTQAQADAYAKQPIRLASTSAPAIHQGCANSKSTVINAGFFCAYVVQWLSDNNVLSETQLETGGYSIVTTLDPNTQNAAEQKLTAALPATSTMTGVLPVLNPTNGYITAMASTKTYGLATSAKDNTHTIQPIFTSYTATGASTWKLFPLLAALSIGTTPSYALQNLVASTPGQDGYPQRVYSTHNCSTQQVVHNSDEANYTSIETLQSAMAKSSNTYFVALADELFNCNPQPIVEMAQRLGMKALDQPSTDGKNTEAQSIINNQSIQQLVLGSVPTSPLELTAAYAAVANNGVYNAPTPIKSITSPTSTVKFPQPAGQQVIAPYVAAEATAIMQGDTTSGGTAAQTFDQYWTSKQPVAGKTGTSVGYVGSNGNYNGALWFVGMTPDVVATSAVINFNSSSAAASDLPGVANPSTEAYGAYASGLWAQALEPTFGNGDTAFTQVSQVQGVTVPSLTGLSVAAATTQLAAQGLKISVLDESAGLTCGSSAAATTIATGGPAVVSPGGTVSVCLSNGAAPDQGQTTTTIAPTSGANGTNGQTASGGVTTPGGQTTPTSRRTSPTRGRGTGTPAR